MLAATQPERKYLLGVQQSLSGKAWVQRPVANETHAEFMAGDYDLPPVVARAMLARGVTLDNVEAYLLPSMQDMPDPFSLQDMHEAANIVHSAVDEKKKIAIFADYDVDGNCSGALLVHFFRLLGVEATLYIPDRYREGYGLNVAAIQKLVGDDQHRLLITVDCGSTSVKEVALARQLGADVIILDHHDVGDVLPHANAMVNPKQKHDRSGLNYLCAAGVAFLFAVAARALFRARGQWTSEQQSQLMSMLDVVALATVADMVPLVGFNRVLVSTGLRYMAQTQNLGLQSLADVAKVNLGQVRAHNLGFHLGPRINAGGRIAESSLGAQLLLTNNADKARQLAEQLNRCNSERQKFERELADIIIKNASTHEAQGVILAIDHRVLSAADDFRKGVIGLAASRLLQQTGKPVFAMVPGADGQYTGSARSVPGVDVGALARLAVRQGIASKGGGHAMAAGVTVPADKLDDFAQLLATRAPAVLPQADYAVDGLMTPGALTMAFAKSAERMEPCGQENPPLTVALAACQVVGAQFYGEKGSFMRCRLQSSAGSITAIAGLDRLAPAAAEALRRQGSLLHVAGRPQPNEYQGRQSVQFSIEDVALA